jgi:hypothetical protein
MEIPSPRLDTIFIRHPESGVPPPQVNVSFSILRVTVGGRQPGTVRTNYAETKDE